MCPLEMTFFCYQILVDLLYSGLMFQGLFTFCGEHIFSSQISNSKNQEVFVASFWVILFLLLAGCALLTRTTLSTSTIGSLQLYRDISILSRQSERTSCQLILCSLDAWTLNYLPLNNTFLSPTACFSVFLFTLYSSLHYCLFLVLVFLLWIANLAVLSGLSQPLLGGVERQ